MKKALTIIAVIVAVAVIAILPFMRGTLIWDGSSYVPITISVFDDDLRPVSGASVCLISPRDEDYIDKISDDEYRELLLSDKRIVETDELGSGTIGGRFPAGGSAGVFKKRGRFTVVGDILIRHPEFQDFRVSLRNLVQASEFSIDQSELDLVAFLKPNQAEQAGDGQARSRFESIDSPDSNPKLSSETPLPDRAAIP